MGSKIITIGFVGLGTIGNGMVINLLKNGFRIQAYNRTRANAESIGHENYSIADSPGDAAFGADAVFTCVSDDTALEEVLFSEKGVMSRIGKGTVLIDSSTISVDLAARIAEESQKLGVDFLDAPITGSKLGAESGNLLFMVGGDKEIFEKCLPAFEAMGKQIIYCGKNTYGERMKLALNLSQALIFEGYIEGVVMALKEGIPLATVLEVLDNSGAKNSVATFKMPYIINRDFEPHFKTKLMLKDIKLAQSELKKIGLDLPLSNHILSVYETAGKKGLSEKDWSSTVELIEEKAGVKIQ